MIFRVADASDARVLAAMNHQLIRDQGSRNRMSVEELEQRMRGWLEGEYQAAVFEADGAACGYALFRPDEGDIHLRQFFIRPEHRRKGLGRSAMHWLIANLWSQAPRIRIDVLIGNAAGIAFWEALGFRTYCLTMEREHEPGASGPASGAATASEPRP